MTDFDPNATPFCDSVQRPCSDFIDEEWVVYISEAEKLERRARVAEHELEQTKKKLADTEEKLRIAIDALQASFPGQFGDVFRRHNKEKLEEIERVGQ